jgi:hypothetical protein
MKECTKTYEKRLAHSKVSIGRDNNLHTRTQVALRLLKPTFFLNKGMLAKKRRALFIRIIGIIVAQNYGVTPDGSLLLCVCHRRTGKFNNVA